MVQDFVLPIKLRNVVREFSKKFINSNFLGNIKEDEFIVEFTDLYCDLNYLHPFREGNGRIQRLFLSMLVNSLGKMFELFTNLSRLFK